MSGEAAADPFAVGDLAALEALYATPKITSTVKEQDRITPDYRRFVEAAPFALLATQGPGGIDVSPRGDPAPLVTVEDPKTLLLPDRRGNNRIDTLRNLMADPRIGVLFLIPGIGETIRVIGRATVTTDPGLRARLAHRGQEPVTVLRIAVETVFFQCQKAVVRAGLWKAEAQVARADLPSTGAMLERMSAGEVDGAAYDAEYPGRMARTLY